MISCFSPHFPFHSSLNVPEVVTLDNDNDEENQAPSGRQDSAEVEVELEVLAGPKGARGGGLTITPTSAQASANIRPGQILQKLKEKNPGRTNFARNFRNGLPKINQQSDAALSLLRIFLSILHKPLFDACKHAEETYHNLCFFHKQ